jgi:uncharacterized protein (TIGR00297 family)
VAGTIAIVALRARALTLGGAVAAFIVGTITFACGSIGTALLLIVFFGTSVALSRSGKAQKQKLLVDVGKTGARDAVQVLANGGVATVCILAWVLLDHSRGNSWWFAAFAGAYAAATADTWGTEIGVLAPQPPRSILTGKPLAAGLSGGVSAPGTAAEFAGAALIAVLAPPALLIALPAGAGIPLTLPVWFPLTDQRSAFMAFAATLAFAVLAGGFLGAIIDSLLGAILQARRWCPACERECETDPHDCGRATVHRRGLTWMTNDVVNAAATLGGAAIAGGAWYLLLRALR